MAEAWAAKFYNSPEWKALRMSLIIQRGPRCQRCGKDMTFDQINLIAHHKKPLTPMNITDPNVSLNTDNIELICFDCHNREHGRFGYSKEHNVFLVYGSPLSGKTTLIKQLSSRGDLIVDINALFKAVSGLKMYDKPDNLKWNVFKIRDALIEQIAQRDGKWNDAYIEGGYPLKAVREHIKNHTGAKEIYCNATKEECNARAETMGIFANDYKKYISKWFLTFQP